jgi:hypothetical protein
MLMPGANGECSVGQLVVKFILLGRFGHTRREDLMSQTSLAHATDFRSAVLRSNSNDDPDAALVTDTISDLCHLTSSPLDCHLGVDQIVLLSQQTSYIFLVRLVFERAVERVV